MIKQFTTPKEIHEELDRLDALLGRKMEAFDENKSPEEFRALMAECQRISDEESEVRQQFSKFK